MHSYVYQYYCRQLFPNPLIYLNYGVYKELSRAFPSTFLLPLRLYYKYILILLLAYGVYLDANRDSNTTGEKSKHHTNVYFKDVRGIDEFKEDLEEIVQFLKKGEAYKNAGAEIPRGILLNGPPGTGKTLMAKALASEAGVNFFYRSGSEFEEIFVGVGADRIRKLFKMARKNTPCIIFIDEIDAIANRRNERAQFGVMNDCLNQLLTEMDG